MTTATAQTTRRRERPPKERTQAPKVSIVDEYYHDPSEEVIVRAKKAMLKEGRSLDGKKFCYGDPKQDADYYIDQGYEFVITQEENGKSKQWRHKGDPLMIIDVKVHQRQGDMVAQLSREQFTSTMEGDNEAFATRDRDGVNHRLTPD